MSCAFRPNHAIVVSGSEDRHVRVWDIETREMIQVHTRSLRHSLRHSARATERVGPMERIRLDSVSERGRLHSVSAKRVQKERLGGHSAIQGRRFGGPCARAFARLEAAEMMTPRALSLP